MKHGHERAWCWVPATILAVLCGAAGAQPAADLVKISGRVTDFQNRPMEGASVELKDAHFETVSRSLSGKDGHYSMAVPKGRYMALAAVKDYQVRCLEYWAWDVPAERDLEINPRFDRLEVYAINAWRPQGAYPSYQIYFRPMSLVKTVAAVMKAGGMEGLNKLPLIDISPDLEAGDIEVRVDGERVDVLRVNKVREAGGPARDMFAYLIQVALPKTAAAGDWTVFDVTLSDRTTGEKGEGRLYLPLPRWR